MPEYTVTDKEFREMEEMLNSFAFERFMELFEEKADSRAEYLENPELSREESQKIRYKLRQLRDTESEFEGILDNARVEK